MIDRLEIKVLCRDIVQTAVVFFNHSKRKRHQKEIMGLKNNPEDVILLINP